MRITYNIFWVEDHRNFFESVQDTIKEYLTDIGFKVQINPYFTVPNIDELIRTARNADLIVMDYQLGTTINGSEIIQQIRNATIYTEVVFYSNAGPKKLREQVKEYELDGVFCCRRDGIAEDLRPIIHSTIRKILDLENFRGLVLAEISDIDHLLKEILKKYRSSHNEKSKFIFDKMLEKAKETHQKNSTTLTLSLEHTNDEHFITMLETHSDFSKRLNLAISISNKEQLKNISETLKKLTDGTNKNGIVSVRNLLAHASPVVHHAGFKFSGLPNREGSPKEWVLNEKSSEQYRKNIIQCKDSLEDLLKKL